MRPSRPFARRASKERTLRPQRGGEAALSAPASFFRTFHSGLSFWHPEPCTNHLGFVSVPVTKYPVRAPGAVHRRGWAAGRVPSPQTPSVPRGCSPCAPHISVPFCVQTLQRATASTRALHGRNSACTNESVSSWEAALQKLVCGRLQAPGTPVWSAGMARCPVPGH